MRSFLLCSRHELIHKSKPDKLNSIKVQLIMTYHMTGREYKCHSFLSFFPNLKLSRDHSHLYLLIGLLFSLDLDSPRCLVDGNLSVKSRSHGGKWTSARIKNRTGKNSLGDNYSFDRRQCHWMSAG